MNYSVWPHREGDKVFPLALRLELESAISVVSVKPARGASSKIRNQILSHLKTDGWSGSVAISNNSRLTITSMKQDVAICLQTGNMARIYADLMKLQTLYLDESITSAAIVLPSYEVARLLGSNIAQATRLERELEVFQKSYTVPTLVFEME